MEERKELIELSLAKIVKMEQKGIEAIRQLPLLQRVRAFELLCPPRRSNLTNYGVAAYVSGIATSLQTPAYVLNGKSSEIPSEVTAVEMPQRGDLLSIHCGSGRHQYGVLVGYNLVLLLQEEERRLVVEPMDRLRQRYHPQQIVYFRRNTAKEQ